MFHYTRLASSLRLLLTIGLLDLPIPLQATSIAHQKAPDFPTAKGKVILVVFGKELAYTKKLQKRYRPLGLAVEGVSSDDDRATARQFREGYGVDSEPAQFLIGPDRLIVYSHHGPAKLPELDHAIQETLKTFHP